MADLYGAKRYDKRYLTNGVKVRQFSHDPGYEYNRSFAWHDYGHALGLHACLGMVNTEYVLFADPDTVFTTDVAKYYMSFVNDYGLDMVGMGNIMFPSYGVFPCVISCLVKKCWLPGPDFLSGRLLIRDHWCVRAGPGVRDEGIAADGMYLLQGPVAGVWQDFPNPGGNYDVGCNLWYWCKIRGGKWLCFAERSCDYESNFGLEMPKPTTQPVIHYRGGSTKPPRDAWQFISQHLSQPTGGLSVRRKPL